jgi:hypothetical protein
MTYSFASVKWLQVIGMMSLFYTWMKRITFITRVTMLDRTIVSKISRYDDGSQSKAMDRLSN